MCSLLSAGLEKQKWQLTSSGKGTGGGTNQLFLTAVPSQGWSKVGPHKEEQLNSVQGTWAHEINSP